jgi:YD repeat-containing protein
MSNCEESKSGVLERGAAMKFRVTRFVVLLVSCAGFFLAGYCQANDWDYDRAQYLTDAQARHLRGPVRSLITRGYTDGSPPSSDKSEFDRKGNLVRFVIITSLSQCSVTTSVNDANGNRVSDSTSSGQPKPGEIECQNIHISDEGSYTYVFNKQGLPRSEKRRGRFPGIALDLPERITTYSYDSSGRPIRIESSSSASTWFNEYSYGSDPRGIRIRKHSYHNDGSVTIDIIRDLLYAADGRFLEATNSPPDVFGVGGGEVEVYDKEGRLIQENQGSVVTKYTKHDKYGNWTVSQIGSTREVRSFTYY